MKVIFYIDMNAFLLVVIKLLIQGLFPNLLLLVANPEEQLLLQLTMKRENIILKPPCPYIKQKRYVRH